MIEFGQKADAGDTHNLGDSAARRKGEKDV